MSEEIKRPRGRPKMIQEPEQLEDKVEEPVNPTKKKAGVVSEDWYRDVTEVKKKDPNLRYCWGRQSSDREQNQFVQNNYTPARGREEILSNPLVAEENGSGIEGQLKTRGDRILMCCPKADYETRQKDRASRYLTPEQAAAFDAKKINQGLRGTGVRVVPEGKTETI